MANERDNNDVVFVYTGGDQRVPQDVTHAIVDRSVTIIRRRVFYECKHLASIEMHDGVEIIEENAFYYCTSLKRINLSGVRIIKDMGAFNNCTALEDVVFGDKLELIGQYAFNRCTSLRNINIPNVRVVRDGVFYGCEQLTELELPEDVERIGYGAISFCPSLRRIVIPLKRDMINNIGFFDVFEGCHGLSHVDLVGDIHKTISLLHLESWRNDMNDEIDSINQNLSTYPANHKTAAIQDWIEGVLERVEFFKSEHCTLLKEAMTLLELALWKAKLDEIEGGESCHWAEQPVMKVNDDRKTENARRQEKRITSGASIVIKNILPFLKLE
jgi:hypothetical protein